MVALKQSSYLKAGISATIFAGLSPLYEGIKELFKGLVGISFQ